MSGGVGGSRRAITVTRPDYLIPSLQLLVGLRVVQEKSQRAASCWILKFQSLGRRELSHTLARLLALEGY